MYHKRYRTVNKRHEISSLAPVERLQYFLWGRFKEWYKHWHNKLHKCILERQDHQRNISFKAELAKFTATMTVASVWLQKLLGSQSGLKLFRTPRLHFLRLPQQSSVKGWTRWVPWTEERTPKASPSRCCFSRRFCSGKGFTCVWWGLGGGKCWGNLWEGWEQGRGCPPGDKISHYISWILAHHMLSFLEYLCRCVMRGISVCSVFLRAWLYFSEMSSGKSEATSSLHEVLSQSIPHKKNPKAYRLTTNMPVAASLG